MTGLRDLVVIVVAGLIGVVAVVGPGLIAGREAITEFSLTSLAGDQIGPSDFAGQVVVLDFWASWCAPCRIQADILHGLEPELEARGVQVLAINLGEDDATVEAYLAENPANYPVLLDPEDTLTPRLDILGLPTLMVLDREGRIAHRQLGLIGRDQLLALVDAAG